MNEKQISKLWIIGVVLTTFIFRFLEYKYLDGKIHGTVNSGQLLILNVSATLLISFFGSILIIFISKLAATPKSLGAFFYQDAYTGVWIVVIILGFLWKLGFYWKFWDLVFHR